MSDTILQVFVFRDGEYVGNEVFPSGEVVVGTGPSADLHLDDPSIAAEQALLNFDGQQATLLDLTQTNTTHINQTPIQHSYVTPRDEIHLGAFTIKIKFLNRNASNRPSRAPMAAPSAPPSAPFEPQGVASSRRRRGPSQVDQSFTAPQNSGPSSLGMPSGLPSSEEGQEPQTEILSARAPSTHPVGRIRPSRPSKLADARLQQAKIPTDLVRPRDAERSSAIQAAIVGATGDIEGPAETAAFEIDSQDVLGAQPSVSGSQESRSSEFSADHLKSESLEVMLDSAFMTPDVPNQGPTEVYPARDDRQAEAPLHYPPEPAANAALDSRDRQETRAILKGQPAPKAPSAPLTNDRRAPNAPLTNDRRAPRAPLTADRQAPRAPLTADRQAPRASLTADRRHQGGQSGTSEERASRGVMLEAQSGQAVPPSAPLAAVTADRQARGASLLSRLSQKKPKSVSAPFRLKTGANGAVSSPKLRIPNAEPEPVVEELDEEELDAEQRPGFSLVDQLTIAPGADRNDRHTAIEVVAFAGADVRCAHVLAKPGEQYVLGRRVQGQRAPDAGHPGLRLVRLSGPGVAELEFTAAAKGQIRKQGRAADLDGLKKPEHASGRTNRFRVALKTGMDARIRIGQLAFHVRFVPPPKPVPNQAPGKFDAFFPRAFGGAVAAHFILGFLLVLLGTETTFSSEASEAYAEITEQPPRDVEIKPEPEPEPPPEIKPQPQPEPEPPPPPPKKKK
ncbi:MAG: FHA domain-containing protein, partial [Myxococcota bacterium]